MKSIVIIGGGLSGSLTALNLIRRGGDDISITLVEKEADQLMKGAAYSSNLPHQLLNVPVSGMSLYEDRPDHFLLWMHSQGIKQFAAHDFAPRDIYGHYISWAIPAALADSPVSFKKLIAEVTDIERDVEGFSVMTSEAGSIGADIIVICTGNFRPQDVPGLSSEAKASAKYISDPWSGSYLDCIDRIDDVLLVGTGLTMVDQLLSLHKRDHQGKIHLLSRRGFLPHSHGPAPEYRLRFQSGFDLRSISACVNWLRKEVKNANQAGASWISVLNAIREATPQLWANLDESERARFMRHVRPYWEVHRHRIPATSLAIINELIEAGQVVKVAGRIQNIHFENPGFVTSLVSRQDKSLVQVCSDWIINCTGPHPNIRKVGSQLVNNLLEKGLVHTDPSGLGLSITKSECNSIFLVGPPAKGIYWECTALREIRKFSDEVAGEIVNQVNKVRVYEDSILA